MTYRPPMINPLTLNHLLRCQLLSRVPPPPSLRPGPDAPALTVRVPPPGTDNLANTVAMPAAWASRALATSILGLAQLSLAHRPWRCVPLLRRSRPCLLPLFQLLLHLLLSQRRYLLSSHVLAVFCSSLHVFTEVTTGRYATRASRTPGRTSPTVHDLLL